MIIDQAASIRHCCSPRGFTVSPIASAPVDFGLLAGKLLNQSCFHVLPHRVSCVCVHYAVTIMFEQVPTITDTTSRQPVDSEAVSFTDDTTGRFIEASRVSVLECCSQNSVETLTLNSDAVLYSACTRVAVPTRCARCMLISLKWVTACVDT